MYPTRILMAGTLLAIVAGCGSETTDDVPNTTPAPTVNSQTEDEFTPAQTLAQLEVNGGTYELDKGHASLVWTVSHNGLSKYTTRFTDFDATILLDTANPAASTVSASINPVSVRTDHPSGPDWDATLANDNKWFNAETFPAIAYASTGVTNLSAMSGIVQGELSLLGITQAVDLSVTMNGARNFPWYGERDVIGFSATANLKRSDFGMLALLPDIGDEVSIRIEAEFVQAE